MARRFRDTIAVDEKSGTVMESIDMENACTGITMPMDTPAAEDAAAEGKERGEVEGKCVCGIE